MTATAKTRILLPTPEQAQGPFYPPSKPADQDNDLTVVKGIKGRAKGQVLYVTGRVLDTSGKPLAGARLEIWQANAAGRYIHPDDTNPALLDPAFQGYGTCTADAKGNYRLKTVKPAAYPAMSGWTRPPHVHFMIAAGKRALTTQMYFPGEPLNEKDRLYGPTPGHERLLAKLLPPTQGMEPNALMAEWDIVLG